MPKTVERAEERPVSRARARQVERPRFDGTASSVVCPVCRWTRRPAAAAAAVVTTALPCNLSAAHPGVTQRPAAPCRGPASGAMPLPRA